MLLISFVGSCIPTGKLDEFRAQVEEWVAPNMVGSRKVSYPQREGLEINMAFYTDAPRMRDRLEAIEKVLRIFDPYYRP